MDQFGLEFDVAPQRRVLTVSELNRAIRGVLDSEFSDVRVAGEISGLKLATSGHLYFTLKERDSQVRCVAFRSAHRYWKHRPKDGMAVILRGRIDVYEARGEYQLLVESLEPQGVGALQAAFEKLKQKLADEGLFERERKRPLPRFPRRIGIVTSLRGAVVSDLLHVLERRFPGLHIRIFPALVQGEGSVEEVCRGLLYFSRTGWAEVVIVARGGGSLEDLWTFNEEAVARAIVACPVPVISAIGHETDFTIADFVADLRAPTPSAAAELVVRTRQELLEGIAGSRRVLAQHLRYRLSQLGRALQHQGIDRALGVLHRAIGRKQQRIDECEYRLREQARGAVASRDRIRRALEERLRQFDVRPRLARDRHRRETAENALVQASQRLLALRRSRFERVAAQLDPLSPLRILDRGYAIVTGPEGIVKEAAAVAAGERLRIRVARGQFDAVARPSVPQ